MHKQWEYKTITAPLGIDVLNKLGLDGWELVWVFPHYPEDAPVPLFFKRPLIVDGDPTTGIDDSEKVVAW